MPDDAQIHIQFFQFIYFPVYFLLIFVHSVFILLYNFID